eukprot:6172590-Pleurochrysis_carterae.AAC.1
MRDTAREQRCILDPKGERGSRLPTSRSNKRTTEHKLFSKVTNGIYRFSGCIIMAVSSVRGEAPYGV